MTAPFKCAERMADVKLGIAMAVTIKLTAITITSSIKVNPRSAERRLLDTFLIIIRDQSLLRIDALLPVELMDHTGCAFPWPGDYFTGLLRLFL